MITNIIIKGFRGISKKLEINLEEEKKKKPTSIIIFGDNGTGKSSIIDAIEICLVGKINNRRFQYLETRSNSYINFNQKESEIIIELNDGSIHHQIIKKEENNTMVLSSLPHKLFSLAPFILRRSDILRFWNTPMYRRQITIYKFLNNISEKEAKIEEIELECFKFDNALKEIQKENLDLILNFKSICKVDDETLKKKHHSSSFLRFIEKHYDFEKKMLKEKSIFKNVEGIERKIEILSNKLIENQKKIDSLRKKSKKIFYIWKGKRLAKDELVEELNQIGKYVTKTFFKIFKIYDFISEIKFIFGKKTERSLQILVSTKDGIMFNPTDFFSEGMLDLISFLIFLSLIKKSSERGLPKVLIIDDALNSIDSSFQVLLMDFILKEFSDWQLIFVVHNQLWFEQLSHLCNINKHKFKHLELTDWSYDDGPSYITDIDSSLRSSLKDCLLSGNNANICSLSGLLLEKSCHELSLILPISLIRKHRDKYTLGDLWPGIYKKLKNSNLENIVNDVNIWIVTRNLIGAHYNKWALSLSKNEAKEFGESILALYESIKCDNCFRFIEIDTFANNKWRCRCGNLKIF